MTPLLTGVFASQISGHLTPSDSGAMFPIAMVNVGSSGSSTITFSNIPDTYKHLQIRAFAPSGSYGTIRFNGDTTTSNYRDHYLLSVGSGSPITGSNANNAFFPEPGNMDNVWSGIVDILDYTSTSKYKVARMLEGFDNNGSGELYFHSALWMSTSKITSITISAQATIYGQYSQFALYGIKG